MLEFYTAQYRSINHPDALDITAKTKSIFSPTWELVKLFKDKKITEEEYEKHYLKLMRNSYVCRRDEWEEILSKKIVVLICYCPAHTFCHRYFAARYLRCCGATYLGELEHEK